MLNTVTNTDNPHTAQLLQAIHDARLRLEAARDDLHSAIRNASDAGVTQREIGRAALVSQAEVWKVLRRNKRIS